MNHDVAADRYARLFELPHRMSEDFSLQAICLDYRVSGSEPVPQGLSATWRQLNLPRTLMLGWLLQLYTLARKVSPRVVIASSDCLCVIIGYWLARLTGARFYADLYDDYSTFGLARLPGVKPLYRRALSKADGLSAVSRTLVADLEREFPGKPMLLLESTVDPRVFHPREQRLCRQELGLGQLSDKKFVGVCGGLNNHHGAGTIFEAIPEFEQSDPDVVFVIAGKVYEECPLPRGPNVVYLGMLPHHSMPKFYSAMDVVVVPLSNTRFGYYAFPQKAYEVIACDVPAVVADVGALAQLFEALPQARYSPDSVSGLAACIRYQLEHAERPDVPVPTWAEQAEKLLVFTSAGER
ncbi:glycosyltransferase [Halioglobus maricola]|nr:glycosyltransferase [Halioglobus maricola]